MDTIISNVVAFLCVAPTGLWILAAICAGVVALILLVFALVLEAPPTVQRLCAVPICLLLGFVACVALATWTGLIWAILLVAAVAAAALKIRAIGTDARINRGKEGSSAGQPDECCRRGAD